jgi:hypothetical protein
MGGRQSQRQKQVWGKQNERKTGKDGKTGRTDGLGGEEGEDKASLGVCVWGYGGRQGGSKWAKAFGGYKYNSGPDSQRRPEVLQAQVNCLVRCMGLASETRLRQG